MPKKKSLNDIEFLVKELKQLKDYSFEVDIEKEDIVTVDTFNNGAKFGVKVKDDGEKAYLIKIEQRLK